MNKPIFTLSWYKEFLSTISGKIDVFSFDNWNGGNGILLRHDVDLDLRPALKMGKVEKEFGISSTYFIQVSSDFYNPLSKNNRKRLRELVCLGHEIGLHFDPTVYGVTDKTQLQREVEREANILAIAADDTIKAVSLHCPSVHGMFPLFDGFINAYDSSIFKDDRYISDSCMSFRGKDPHQWADLACNMTIQFLIHPMHFSDEEHSYLDIFSEKIRNESLALEQYFRIIKCFDKELGQNTLLNFVNEKKVSKRS